MKKGALYFCEGCHKVFFYAMRSLAPKVCPNCEMGRRKHSDYEIDDEGRQHEAEIETSDIKLKEITDYI